MSRMADAAIELGRTEAGAECPLCQAGTVEVVGGEVRCRGECGNTAEAQFPEDFVRPMSHAKGDEAIYVPSFAKPIK
jgi:hypothetical protein